MSSNSSFVACTRTDKKKNYFKEKCACIVCSIKREEARKYFHDKKKGKELQKLVMFESEMRKEKYGDKYYSILIPHNKKEIRKVVYEGDVYDVKCCVEHFIKDDED